MHSLIMAERCQSREEGVKWQELPVSWRALPSENGSVPHIRTLSALAKASNWLGQARFMRAFAFGWDFGVLAVDSFAVSICFPI